MADAAPGPAAAPATTEAPAAPSAVAGSVATGAAAAGPAAGTGPAAATAAAAAAPAASAPAAPAPAAAASDAAAAPAAAAEGAAGASAPAGQAPLTTDIMAGPGGVMTDEVGVVTGELTLRSEVDAAGAALVRVQYKDAEEWYVVTGTKTHLGDPADIAAVHAVAVGILNRPEG